MRHCPQCGAQPQTNARFCTQCGARLPTLATGPAVAQPAPMDIPTVIAPAEPTRNLDETMVLPPASRSEVMDDVTHLAPAPQTYDPAPVGLSQTFAASSEPMTTRPQAPRIGEQFANAQVAPAEKFTQTSIQPDADDFNESRVEQHNTSKLIPILAVCIIAVFVIIALMLFL